MSTAESELKQMEDRIASRINEGAILKSSLADNEREKNDLKTERDKLKALLQEAYIQAEGIILVQIFILIVNFFKNYVT